MFTTVLSLFRKCFPRKENILTNLNPKVHYRAVTVSQMFPEIKQYSDYNIPNYNLSLFHKCFPRIKNILTNPASYTRSVNNYVETELPNLYLALS